MYEGSCLSLCRRISFKGAVSEEEVRDSSVEMLQDYLSGAIESIVGSVSQCPPVMRVTFKQLHKRVEEQFTEPENEVSLRTNARDPTVGTTPHAEFLTKTSLLAGCEISGHQWILFPALLCTCHPHT